MKDVQNPKPADEPPEFDMNAAEKWAREFFTGVAVEMWLRVMQGLPTAQEADFLEKVLRLSAGAQVLDLACGGGRHSLELAGRGYRMTGVDLSAEFLAAARAAAGTQGRQIAWEQRAMHDLPWAGVFDGAYCMGNSLVGLDDAEFGDVLKAIARALKPGCYFAVDTGAVAESVLPHLNDHPWWPAGDILFLVHNRYDPIPGRLNMEFTFVQNGRVEKRTAFSQVHTCREFCRLFGEAGFGEFEAYASLAQDPFCLGSHRLLLVARKKPGP